MHHISITLAYFLNGYPYSFMGIGTNDKINSFHCGIIGQSDLLCQPHMGHQEYDSASFCFF